jgi:hypothetical protein
MERNMRKLLSTTLLAALAASLIACGGDDAFKTPEDGGGPTGPVASSITLQTSAPQIQSDGSAPATVTAFVRDENNAFLADVPVVFQADSGGLAITQATTDVNGIATATLNVSGDPTPRVITVSAAAGEVSDTVTVNVAGTGLTLSGPASLVLGDAADYTVVLTDSGGQGIPDREVTISSDNGNTLSATTLTTDSTGRGTVSVTADVAGADTLSATTLGLTATRAFSVSNDSFVFSVPDANTEIPLNEIETITVTWTVGGAPVQNETISFSTTRGTLSAANAVTNLDGQASVTISSTNAGGGVVTASADTGGITTQLPLEFVAETPATVEVQASPTTIGTSEQSTITAVVRDADNNLVKNKTVTFQVVNDVTGGTLSVGSAVTDSQGRAQTVYTASTTTSGNEGVTIRAAAQGFAGVFDDVSLTVAQKALFLSLGTGNEIFEPTTAEYYMEYAVHATDAAGNGVDGVSIQMSIKSVAYLTGRLTRASDSDPWVPEAGHDVCRDEDVNENGIFDAGEDVNSSLALEAGNIALVTPGSVVTADGGFALVRVRYPQDHANWVLVRLTAKATVQGTETTRSTSFVLAMSAADAESDSPPGPLSPFGLDDPACTPYP